MNNISRLSNHISEYSYLRPRVFPTFCFQCHDFLKKNNNKAGAGQVHSLPVIFVPAICCTSCTVHLGRPGLPTAKITRILGWPTAGGPNFQNKVWARLKVFWVWAKNLSFLLLMLENRLLYQKCLFYYLKSAKNFKFWNKPLNKLKNIFSHAEFPSWISKKVGNESRQHLVYQFWKVYTRSRIS